MKTPRGGVWPWRVLAVAAVLIGIALRVDQLSSQALMDDEWHAVRMLIDSSAATIAAHFGMADYCIPLTLYYRWLYNLGMLSEWQMHLPLLLAGIGLLLWASTAKRVAPLPTRAVWTALLAISPALVYMSRTARPYALLALLGPVAILAFRAWWFGSERRGRAAALYILVTAFAGWLHLLSLVFTLWPFAWYGLAALYRALRGPDRAAAWRRVGELAGLGARVAVLLAAVLIWPLLGDWSAMAAKAGTHSVTAESLHRTVLIQFGIGHFVAFVPLALLFAVGVRASARRDRDFVGLILSGAVVGVAVIAAARPAWIHHAGVMVRYTVPFLPWLLLFVAEGIVTLAQSRLRPALATGAVALALTALVAAGPLPRWFATRPNQFIGHAAFQFDYDDRENPYLTLYDSAIPAFYRDLAALPPGSITLIETPASFVSNYQPGPWYQAVHRQKLKFALASPICGESGWDEYPYHATGLDFRRMVPLGDLLDGATYGGRYLVMRLRPWVLPTSEPLPWPDLAACVATVSAKLGEPVHRDDEIVVFELGRRP